MKVEHSKVSPVRVTLLRGHVYNRPLRDGSNALYLCGEDSSSHSDNRKLCLINLENGYFCKGAQDCENLTDVTPYYIIKSLQFRC